MTTIVDLWLRLPAHERERAISYDREAPENWRLENMRARLGSPPTMADVIADLQSPVPELQWIQFADVGPYTYRVGTPFPPVSYRPTSSPRR
jgi:hypothetical protein